MRTQCELLDAPRSSGDYRPVGESEEDRDLRRLMDEIYLIDPCIGTRRLVTVLETIWFRPRNTNAPNNSRRKSPHLLGSLEAARSGLVRGHHGCADVARARVSVRGDGLVFAQCAGLAVVQHGWACAWMRGFSSTTRGDRTSR